MRRRRVNIPVKPLFIILAALVVAAFIIGYARQLLTTSDYFRVKDVAGPDLSSGEISRLKGKNIFLLDLPGEAMNISKSCPDCLRVRLARVLPDRLFAQFIKRNPVALVKLYRYFAVDQDGVFFESSLSPQDSGLPLITGLEGKLSGIKPGKGHKSKEMFLALAIIKEAAKFRNLRSYRIQRIDAVNADDITIFIPVGPEPALYLDWQAPQRQKILEVKISQGNIVEKIAIMSGLINQEKERLGDIKYIDLRFNEPVIKFKDAK